MLSYYRQETDQNLYAKIYKKSKKEIQIYETNILI